MVKIRKTKGSTGYGRSSKKHSEGEHEGKGNSSSKPKALGRKRK